MSGTTRRILTAKLLALSLIGDRGLLSLTPIMLVAVIGAVLFVGTLIIGIIRQRARRSSA